MSDETTREFTTVGVIGLGTMGAGIAEVFARNGYAVIGVEVNETGVERGRQHLEHSTGRAVKREKMTEEQQAELLGRITLTTEMADLSVADLVVEAVVEAAGDAAIVKVMADPDLKERFAGLGVEATASTQADFRTFIAAEHAKYAKLVADNGITGE